MEWGGGKGREEVMEWGGGKGREEVMEWGGGKGREEVMEWGGGTLPNHLYGKVPARLYSGGKAYSIS